MRIGIAGRPKPGESVSGDDYFCGEVGDGFLVCLIDGIGHGEEGHDASRRLVRFLQENKEADLDELLRRSHEELHGTRGAVVGLALIRENEGSIRYAGVGNITAVVVETDGQEESAPSRHLISIGGIVGYNLRKVKQFECPYQGGDALVMYTDGISSRFSASHYFGEDRDPQEIAEAILREQGKDNDDALVLIVERPKD